MESMTKTKRTPARLAVTAPTRLVRTHLAGLDGLRAIAVAAVVLYHVVPGLLPGGGLGVDIFFVISGFLITGLLFSERDETGRIRLGHFWFRRVRRLVPALALLVLVCGTATLGVGGDLLVGMGREVLGAATFSSNWLAIASGPSYFTATTPEVFQNLWSLAVEEQFYLIWPFVVLLVLLLKRAGERATVFLVLAIASATTMAILYSPTMDATRVYFGTDTHSFGLAIGAVLAVLTRSLAGTRLEWPRWQRRLLPIPGVIAFLALLAATVLLPANSALTFQGGLAAVAVLTAVAIWGAIIPGSLLGRMLDLPPIRWMGVRSYGIYLWHWPVLVLLLAAFPRWQDAPATAWLVGTLAVVVSVAAAALSYRFVETPIRQNGFRAWATAGFRRGRRRAVRAIGAVVVILVLLATAGGTGLAVTHAPPVGHAQKDIAAGKVAIARARMLPPPPPGSAGSDIDAVGDSVMLAAAPELQQTFPGISIDAVVSRQMRTLPDIVSALLASHELRGTLLVGLGTNGSISAATLEQVHQLLGDRRQMVVVTVQAPRGWTPGVNQILSTYAAEYDNVELADWADAIAPHISILAADHIHPGAAGGRIYAEAVKEALARLAAIPPYPNVVDFLVKPPSTVTTRRH
jgi:peptidoglycan/LPS O-acetylase OafA/YrhL